MRQLPRVEPEIAQDRQCRCRPGKRSKSVVECRGGREGQARQWSRRKRFALDCQTAFAGPELPERQRQAVEISGSELDELAGAGPKNGIVGSSSALEERRID